MSRLKMPAGMSGDSRTWPGGGEPAAALEPGLSHGDLLNDLDTLAGLLRGYARSGSWLDAYLVAAGMVQVADDWLHDVPGGLDRALAATAARLDGRLRPPLVGTGEGMVSAATSARRLLAGGRAVARWRLRAIPVLDALAARVIAGDPATEPAAAAELAAQAERAAAAVRDLPEAVRRQLLRLPAAFLRFDQRPADLRALASGLAEHCPERGRPLAVIGIRTSGSYTAPLLAAGLRELGYTAVSTFTYRPGERWVPADSRRLRALAAGQAVAAISDDPPHSGGSVLAAARALQRLGFARPQLVLALALAPGSDRLPAPLLAYPAVLLPSERWELRRRLEPAAVEADLRALMGPSIPVRVLERAERGAADPRGHLSALYRVRIGERVSTVLAQGIGLGYLGSHATTVCESLSEHLPRTYGARDGILYREWLPDSARVGSGVDPDPPVAAGIADYVAHRARVLASPSDPSQRLGRRGSAWKAAGDVLAAGFGRAALPMRPLLRASARRLLRTQEAAVVDGNMHISRWFRDESGHLVKVGAHEGGFSAADLYCYDPTFDLAGAAVDTTPDFTAQVRAAYEAELGTEVDAERWLLYRLLHIRARLARRPRHPGADRELARALQDYYAETLFADARAPDRGPLCAVDVDGVVETPGLGFSGTTPAGALALRALALHGYRVMLATGRSVEDVRDRCRAYPIVGGVAEYGAALLTAVDQEPASLLSPPELVALACLRERAGRLGLVVDPAHRGSLRAARLTGGGELAALDADQVARLLTEPLPVAFRAVQGARQTDFTPEAVSKGRAVLSLIARLGGGEDCGRPLALAVGDSQADLSFLALAELPLLTGNAAPAARRAGFRVLGRPCQLGLALAVRQLLGHQPGACPVCRPPRLAARSRLVLTALSAPEQPRLRKLGVAAGLVAAMGALGRA